MELSAPAAPVTPAALDPRRCLRHAGRNRPGAGPRAPRPAAIGAWPQPPMRLTGIESVEGGVAFLTYERARDA
jgi:hypothetical protein